jgi:Mg2+ and Co2+ transporter CorA
MGVGGPCTCGDDCKCSVCPTHRPTQAEVKAVEEALSVPLDAAEDIVKAEHQVRRPLFRVLELLLRG